MSDNLVDRIAIAIGKARGWQTAKIAKKRYHDAAVAALAVIGEAAPFTEEMWNALVTPKKPD